jgi:hypothetical protein
MELTSLPEPVRRYVESVLLEPPLPVRAVRVAQVGEMLLKPGARPLRFKAVEEFSVDTVAFTWRARFPLIGPIALRVTDRYQPPEGLLEVRLLGIPVRRQRGADVARGEAFRYLAELPWAPHAITANQQLNWKKLDERTCEVSTRVADEEVAVRLIFDGPHVIRTEAERPGLESGGTLTRWVGEYGDYAVFDGIRAPTRAAVRWELPDGPFTYWRGTITAMQTRS